MKERVMPKTVEGAMKGDGLRVALVVSRFNEFITSRLEGGAVDALVRHGVAPADVTIVRVPGAMEIPLACHKAARSGHFDAVVALGCVIRGATPHFDQVCAEATRGVGRAAYDTGVPVGYGVLTCDTMEQAIERAGAKAGNKGVDAALAALEMVSVLRQLT
jgi:6,7-dimethyl-8-ribityllumazine synthase